jgi:hypothetical protein
MHRGRRQLLWLCGLLALWAAGSLPAGAHAAPSREPVIIIPGVAGSELTATSAFRLSVGDGRGGTFTRDYRAGEKVWVNTLEALRTGDDDYFDVLKLQADGRTPVAPALAPSGIYGGAYDDLIAYLERQGYVRDVDLWLFPYDWRMDIRAAHERLDTLVSRALVTANRGQTDPGAWTVARVDLIGHSMGGLVGRSYVADPARAARVDQLITLGSPQLGSAKFLKTLMYGDAFGPYFLGIGLNPLEIRDVVQNMPGAMQLLPSRPYYRYYDGSDGARLSPYVEDRDVDGDGRSSGALTYDAVDRLLRATGANGTVLGVADSYHREADELRNGGLNGVRWYALAGYGHATTGQLREYTGACWTWSGYKPCPKRDELPVDGDGTVGLMSATMGDPYRQRLIDSGASLAYVRREHGALVADDELLGARTGDGPVLTWIGEQLRAPGFQLAEMPLPAVLYLPRITLTTPEGGRAEEGAASANAVHSTPPPSLEGVWIAALGPVALEAQDAGGAVSGRGAGVEEARLQIHGSSYERLPESEFLFVQHDSPYTLRLAADREGSTDLKLRWLSGGEVGRTVVYLGIRLGPNGRAELAIEPGDWAKSAAGDWPALAVDQEGDGFFEARVPASAVLDARASADADAPLVSLAAPQQKAGGDAVTIHWSADDAGAGLLRTQATIDPDTPGARLVQNGENVSLPAGPHRLVVIAQDLAGNTSVHETAFEVSAVP